MRRLFASLLLLVSLSLPYAGLHAQQRPNVGSIVGQVRLTGGKMPTESILVELQFRGASIKSAFTDSEGRFAFYELLNNPYHVAVNSEGYLPFSRQVYVRTDVNPTTIVHIILTPKEKAQPESPRGPASGGNPHLVDISEYLKQFPSKVEKAFQAGVKADGEGKAEEAIRHYQKALDLAPDFYPARNNLGSIYLSRADFEAAEREFSQVIELNRNDALAYFNLGNVFYLTRRYEDAAQTLQQGLEREPGSALGNYLLASVEARRGNVIEAERRLRAALESDPKMFNARLELANLYLQQQRAQEAAQELKLFIADCPDTHPLLPRARDVLKALQGPAAQAP